MQNDEVKLLVTVKPLEWQGDFAHTGLGLFYHVDHATGTPGWVVLEKIEGSSTTKSGWHTIAQAQAEAERDYTQRILARLSSIPSTVSGETVPDEVTEDHLQRLAEKMLAGCGWKAGDAMGYHPVRQLLIRFGMLVKGVELDRCGYPECGCDDDATCSVAFTKIAASPANPAETQAVELGK